MRSLFLAILAVVLTSALSAQTLYNFETPAEPTSSLVDGGDGFHYGTATRGGSAGKGEVYRVDLSTGQRSTVAAFNGANGSFPYGDVLVQGQFLYGTTYTGGANDLGTVYKVDRSTGAVTTLVSFKGNDGMYPHAGLVAFGSDLYGTTSDGGERGFGGTIFKIDPATGALTSVLGSFPSSSAAPGSKPVSPLLVVGSLLYGTTQQTAFKFDPATRAMTILGIPPSAGALTSGLIAAGPFLYGTANLPTFPGSLFRVDPATGEVTTIFTFSFTDGSTPTGGLVFDGTYLYGTTESSTTSWGTVFRFDPSSATVTTLAQFDFTNGAKPRASLLLKDGLLFGTTSGGGPNNGGSIFKVNPSTGALSTVTFFNTDGTGATPSATPTIDGRTLYGTALEGGARGLGTVFKMDLSGGQVTTLASFDFRSGGNPAANLIVKDGKLYGTAETNGVDGTKFTNNGTVYSVDPATGALTMVAALDATKGTGAIPRTALASAGPYLYGTAVSGGATGSKGTVFRVDPSAKTLTTLYTFVSPYTNGSSPHGGLLLVGSSLWGTTYDGGSLGRGTAYRIDPSNGTVTGATSLAGATGGFLSTANSSLTALGGFLYGTSRFGGQYGKGAVYRVNPDTGAISVVASFNGSTGEYPGEGGLATDGKSLFGTASSGGAYGHGTVFQLDPAQGKLTAVFAFDVANGDAPWGSVVVDGPFLYGTTQYGGTRGGGTLFRVPIPRPRTRAAR